MVACWRFNLVVVQCSSRLSLRISHYALCGHMKINDQKGDAKRWDTNNADVGSLYYASGPTQREFEWCENLQQL